MSEPKNLENERLSDLDSWEKIERRANLEKKSECPALISMLIAGGEKAPYW